MLGRDFYELATYLDYFLLFKGGVTGLFRLVRCLGSQSVRRPNIPCENISPIETGHSDEGYLAMLRHLSRL